MKFPSAPNDPRPFFGETDISERMAVLKTTNTDTLDDQYHSFMQQLEDLPHHAPEVRETHLAAISSSQYRFVIRYRLYGPLPAPTPVPGG